MSYKLYINIVKKELYVISTNGLSQDNASGYQDQKQNLRDASGDLSNTVVNETSGINEFFDEGYPVKSYPIIAGRNSHLGAKEREGDQRTPRGDYYICTVNEQSQFTLFFGISYPDAKDAQRGFDQEMISQHQKDEILEAVSRKERPPWNTPLGGEVGIHGGGIDRDGTRGCIGMRDADVLDLKKYVKPGMTVRLVFPG